MQSIAASCFCASAVQFPGIKVCMRNGVPRQHVFQCDASEQ